MWPYAQSPDSVFSITAPAAYGGLFLAVTLLPLSLHSHSHCSCNCSGFLKVPGEIMEEPDLWTGHSGCLQFLSCQVQLSAFCGFPLFSSQFCHEWCIYSVQSKVPLRGSGHSQTEMVDIMVECFRPSSPGCITDATDVVCLHVVCLYCTASCYTGRPHPLKKLLYCTWFTAICPQILLENNETFSMGVSGPFLAGASWRLNYVSDPSVFS